MNKNVRKITDGSMMIALFAILLLLNRQSGELFEFAFYSLLAIPLILYTMKYTLKDGVVVSFCFLIVCFMFSNLTTIIYFISCILVNYFYCLSMKKQWTKKIRLMILTIINFVMEILATMTFASLFGYNLKEDIAYVNEIFQRFHMQSNLYIIYFVLALSSLFVALLQSYIVDTSSIILLKRLNITNNRMI